MHYIDIYSDPPVYVPRIIEDRMMSAYRAAAEQGILDREDKRHRDAVLRQRRQERKRLEAAEERNRAPLVLTSPDSPLPFPTFRHVSIAERKKERTREDIAMFAERREELARTVSRRLAHGFRQIDPVELSGQAVVGVVEDGLRSEEYKGVHYTTLERWPSLVPRRAKLRTSKGNTALVESRSKLLSLDEPYVEGNREMLGFLRLDTDRVWDSVEQCVEAFRHVAREHGCACPPHLLVGLVDAKGRYWSPHAIWLLPYSGKDTPEAAGAVLNKPRAKGFRPGPLNLFKGVYYGLVAAHAHLGSDPNAPATTQQTKNPLSPYWTTVVVNDDITPTLSEHAEYLDLSATKEKLVREQVRIQTGLDLAASNSLYNTLIKACFTMMSTWHKTGDRDYADCLAAGRFGSLADRLHSEIEAMDMGDLRDKRGRRIGKGMIATALAHAADAAVDRWDPSRLDGKVNRGYLMHECEGVGTLKGRQAIGAAHASSARKTAADVRLHEALDLMMVEGQDITKKAVTRVSSLSYNTVKSKWAQVEARLLGVSNQCIVKKHPACPVVPDQNERAAPVVTSPEASTVAPWILSPGLSVLLPASTYPSDPRLPEPGGYGDGDTDCGDPGYTFDPDAYDTDDPDPDYGDPA